MIEEKLINNLHGKYREDEYIKTLCHCAGLEMDNIDSVLKDIEAQFSFKTMTWAVDLLAKEMNLKLDATLTQEEKNSIIEGRWKTCGKCDINLLQNICNSWKNGSVEVQLVDGKIKLKFSGEYGVPTNIPALKSQLEEVKPAHLIIDYIFSYLLIKEVNGMKISDLEAHKINDFAFITQ